MSDLGKQFAAALDRGASPGDDCLFPFPDRFRASRIRHQLDHHELNRMFRKQVSA